MTPREKILREVLEELVTQSKRFISQDTARLNHAILIARETLARADAETDGWIAAGERLPDSRQHVIAFYTNEHGKGRTSVCQYIAHATVLAEDFLSDDAEGCDVYDEERDCYWVDSGWWEASWEAETNWRITSTVTHWQPLPDAPGGKE